MVLREALKAAIDILKGHDVVAPAVDAGVMLCHTINKDRAFLYAHDDYVLKEDEYERFMLYIKNRVNGMPLQYITGVQEFMSLVFRVGPEVLIPRQDTEILVETVINKLKGREKQKLSILDMCTGSGCIATTLAYYIENSIIYAVDVSPGALKIARSNAVDNGVGEKITFIKSDLYDQLYKLGAKERCFDAIVSNPPYIPGEVISCLQKEVRSYEPELALNGGKDGLDFYRKIIDGADSFLKNNGFLAFEVGYDQAEAVKALMKPAFKNIEIIKDLSGINRVVTGNIVT